jgi:hypothetical protein
MKASVSRIVLAAAAILVAGAATAQAGVDLNVSIGAPAPVYAPPQPVYVPPPPQPVYVPPPQPVYVPPPAPAYYPPEPEPQEVVIDEPPQFIYSPNLGFYVTVGTPYDMIYLNNGYYLNRGGYWYYGTSYWGPWTFVQSRRLPPALHRYRYEQIRHYRDREYRHYMRDRERYRGNFYRPVARPGYGRHNEVRRDEHWRDGRRDEHREGWERERR